MKDKAPKYQEISDWLREGISNGRCRPGDRLTSEPSLCEKFGVSRQTVRSAIAILEKEGLVVRRQGSGTYVSHFLSGAGRKKISLLFTYADDYIFPAIISGVEEVLSKQGHRMSLSLTHNKVENERSQLLSLLGDNIDGLLVEAVKSALPNPNLDLYSELAARGVPILFLNACHNRLNPNYILNSDEAGGRLAARHLIENGHKKIGGIFKHDDLQGAYRYKGFATELYAQNLHLHENHILWYSTETLGQLFFPEKPDFLLDRLKGATAVVCYNDQVAVRFIQACTRAGINIPDDFSVVSFDNSNLCGIASVPLTSITHPGPEMGRLAAQTLLKMIHTPKQEIHHVYQPELVVRASVRNIL